MRDDIDIGINSLLGKNMSNYTLEEIEAAQKRKKKHGGTIMENLAAVTGRSLPNINSSFSTGVAHTKSAIDISSSLNESLLSNANALNSMLDEYTKEVEAYTIGTPDTLVKGEKATVQATQTASNEPEILSNEDALDAFVGMKDEIEKTVFGQTEFVKDLVVAFKRPYVMKPEENLPKNSIFITGPSCSGKHLALNTIVECMAERKIIADSSIHVMDLSLYPDATREKLFMQDLYEALLSKSAVVLFENYEECHVSLLVRIQDLVMKGRSNLSERYVMNNGQLVNVTNALASETVGSLDAKGKFFVFVSRNGLTKLSDIMGAPFVNSIGDVCTAKALDEETMGKIAGICKDRLIKDASENALFALTVTDEFISYSVSMSGKNAGLAGILSFYKDINRALCELRLDGDYKKNAEVSLDVKEGAVKCTIDGEEISVMDVLPGKYLGEIEGVKKELEKIVGLTEIKDYILSLEEYYAVMKRRTEAGLKAGEVNKHMIFTGNPGTGKTTIARIISRYLKACGVLSGGQLVEVSRADLVGRFVGHTAPLTNQVINSAIGGVLFIDEAYSLYRGKDDSFGMEAIDTLVKGIEDNRDNLIVILAGYSNEMDEFLTANSGLKSRFPNIINFPDYTGEELLKIADVTASSKGYVIDEGAKSGLLAYFNMVQMSNAKEAGNGRLVRNTIEDAVLNQSRRLVAEPDADMSLLISEDFDLQMDK